MWGPFPLADGLIVMPSLIPIFRHHLGYTACSITGI